MDATPRWARAVRRPPPCGLGRATSGAERGEWRQQYPVRPGVAVADADNYHERGRWAGPVRVHPIPQLEQVPRSFLDRPLAAELDLDAHPRTARRLDDGIDFQAGIVAVVVHLGVVRLCCAGTGAPRSMAPRDISPVECPDSKSDIGRIESRDIRPAPVCRVVSPGGTAEPVRMKRPAPPPMSTARRTWFQIDGTVCHSSIRRGADPSRTRLGSISAPCRSPASTSRSTSLAAWCRPVAVFPQARGPSISTAPADPSPVASSSSTMRGRYSSTKQSLPAGLVRPPIGVILIEVSQNIQPWSCNCFNRCYATNSTDVSQRVQASARELPSAAETATLAVPVPNAHSMSGRSWTVPPLRTMHLRYPLVPKLPRLLPMYIPRPASPAP